MTLIKFIILALLSISILMAGSAKSIYKKECASCHGQKAEKKALGKSGVIRGMSAKKIVALTKAVASGKKDATQVAKITHKKVVRKYSDKELKAVAEYINKL